MTKMTKEAHANAIATVRENIAPMIVARRERDSRLASAAIKRSDKYLALFASDAFATATVDYGFDLADLFSRCDKTLDRFQRVFDCIVKRDTMQTANASDQNRYTFDLLHTLVGAVNAGANVNKTDVLASASKTDTANDYVRVSNRTMSSATAERQSGIAVYVLELLKFLEREKHADGSVGYKVNRSAKMYRRIVKQITENK